LRVPVFVSCPTALNSDQQLRREVIVRLMEEMQLEPRALGRSDYPTDYPLREVAVIAQHCSGGIILGFAQFSATAGVWKAGTSGERPLDGKAPALFPTDWNHLEAGILFGLRLPLLIFRERGISGGVFDNGVTDVFVHDMPDPIPTSSQLEGLREVFLKWRGRVSDHYYRL
jgi:hypothetical protein